MYVSSLQLSQFRDISFRISIYIWAFDLKVLKFSKFVPFSPNDKFWCVNVQHLGSFCQKRHLAGLEPVIR